MFVQRNESARGAYIVHLAGGSVEGGGRLASADETLEESEEAGGVRTPTAEDGGDMTVVSGHAPPSLTRPVMNGRIKRSESIKSMFATSLGNNQVAEVSCDHVYED